MNCSACGAALAAGSTWCPACGYAVSTSSNASTISYMNFGSFEEPVAAPPIPQTKQARQQSTYIAPITSYGQAVVPGYAAQPVDTLQQIPQVAQSQPQHTSRVLLVTLIVLTILIVIGGSGLFYYVEIYQPAMLKAQVDAQATTQTKMQSTAQIKATATAYANSPQGIYTLATSSAPVIDTSLDGQLVSDWGEYNSHTTRGMCVYRNGAYHVMQATSNRIYYCYNDGAFDNFAMQVQMTIVAGVSGGITFRYNTNTGTFYEYVVNEAGYYSLYIYKGGDVYILLRRAYSTFIKPGLNQPNLLTVIARGSSIYLYINKHFLGQASDSTYTTGNIGLLAEDYTRPVDVAFNNVQVWNLS